MLELGFVSLDATDLTLIATLSLPFVAFLLRKRIGRFIFRSAIESVRDDFFEEYEGKGPDGKKIALRRPNERLSEMLSTYGPGLMDWAVKNVKIKLPPFELPENVDLRTVGMSAIAQKVMSGKKLKLDDAIPLGLSYVKDWLDKSGFLDKIVKKGVKGSETTTEVYHPPSLK